mgnify:CR=1 FL=1
MSTEGVYSRDMGRGNGRERGGGRAGDGVVLELVAFVGRRLPEAAAEGRGVSD